MAQISDNSGCLVFRKNRLYQTTYQKSSANLCYKHLTLKKRQPICKSIMIINFAFTDLFRKD